MDSIGNIFTALSIVGIIVTGLVMYLTWESGGVTDIITKVTDIVKKTGFGANNIEDITIGGKIVSGADKRLTDPVLEIMNRQLDLYDEIVYTYSNNEIVNNHMSAYRKAGLKLEDDQLYKELTELILYDSKDKLDKHLLENSLGDYKDYVRANYLATPEKTFFTWQDPFGLHWFSEKGGLEYHAENSKGANVKAILAY